MTGTPAAAAPAPAAPAKTCANCLYYRPQTTGPVGECCRYPIRAGVTPTYWCGEWAKDG